MEAPKVDLSLLTQLLTTLHEQLEIGGKIIENDNFKYQQYVIEMSKATGLASGLIQEATMIIGDIQTMIRAAGSVKSGVKSSEFIDMPSITKMPKNNGNVN